MNKKDNILIVYPPGGYGTFVDWCLNYFTETIPKDLLPFRTDGSSHSHRPYVHFIGAKTGTRQTTQEYYDSELDYPIVTSHGQEYCHPGVKGWTVKQYIDLIRDYTRQFVVLNGENNSRLLILNNMLTKTGYNLDQQVIDQFRESFGAGEPVPTWQLREMYSYWFDGSTQYFVNGYAPINDPKIINVSIRQLVDNFQPTLHLLFKQLGLDMKRQDQLDEIEKKWLSLQKYSTIDRFCNQIVEATVNNQLLDWYGQELGVLNEGYIQWQLRDLHKLDLLCYNLDVFPTNSVELRKLLINV